MCPGQKVFEWDQTLEEANIYISLPQNVPTKLFYCKIEPKHLEVGIKGSSPYLNVSIRNRGRERVGLCIYRHINVCTRARYYQNNQRGQRGLGQWIKQRCFILLPRFRCPNSLETPGCVERFCTYFSNL
jgi:hypothetical protein